MRISRMYLLSIFICIIITLCVCTSHRLDHKDNLKSTKTWPWEKTNLKTLPESGNYKSVEIKRILTFSVGLISTGTMRTYFKSLKSNAQ